MIQSFLSIYIQNWFETQVPVDTFSKNSACFQISPSVKEYVVMMTPFSGWTGTLSGTTIIDHFYCVTFFFFFCCTLRKITFLKASMLLFQSYSLRSRSPFCLLMVSRTESSRSTVVPSPRPNNNSKMLQTSYLLLTTMKISPLDLTTLYISPTNLSSALSASTFFSSSTSLLHE